MSIGLRDSGGEGAAVDAALSQVEAGVVLGHTLINQLGERGAAAEYAVRNLRELLITRLRITGVDASGRIAAARQFGVTHALTGQPVEPQLAATAAAQHEGAIGTDHAHTIRRFLAHLPAAVGDDERAEAEHALATLARQATATEVAKAAQRLAAHLNPDGVFDGKDRAAKAYVRVGRQGADKMTQGSFCLDPELTAYLEALFAKCARPGRRASASTTPSKPACAPCSPPGNWAGIVACRSPRSSPSTWPTCTAVPRWP